MNSNPITLVSEPRTNARTDQLNFIVPRMSHLARVMPAQLLRLKQTTNNKRIALNETNMGGIEKTAYTEGSYCLIHNQI